MNNVIATNYFYSNSFLLILLIVILILTLKRQYIVDDIFKDKYSLKVKDYFITIVLVVVLYYVIIGLLLLFSEIITRVFYHNHEIYSKGGSKDTKETTPIFQMFAIFVAVVTGVIFMYSSRLSIMLMISSKRLLKYVMI